VSSTVLTSDLGHTVSIYCSKLVIVLFLNADHHVNKLKPLNDTIMIFILGIEHFLNLFIGDLSESKINHDVLELLLVHGTILVKIIVLKGLDECCLL
jgi:hypothetical protein